MFIYLFISPRHLRAPLADRRETSPHDQCMGALLIQVPKLGGPPKKFVAFFMQLQTLIANIFGEGVTPKILRLNI